MPSGPEKIIIATRGSALALVQSNMVRAECESAFPEKQFEIKIFKTTGDKLQTASLASLELPKGLFTKELETALLNGEADLAVHSLKDLPTDLPAGLALGAVLPRADVRDVLIYRTAGQSGMRGFAARLKIAGLPQAATIATSSMRRKSQLLEQRPDLNVVPVRGNVPTRLRKLSEQADMDAIILAAAGLGRLGYSIDENGSLSGSGVPPGLLATKLEPEEMLPCVGQAAIGLEVRESASKTIPLCEKLNDPATLHCVTAERAFLKAMGGGCQLAVGAYAEVIGEQLRLRAVSFLGQRVQSAEQRRSVNEPVQLGQALAAQFKTNQS